MSCLESGDPVMSIEFRAGATMAGAARLAGCALWPGVFGVAPPQWIGARRREADEGEGRMETGAHRTAASLLTADPHGRRWHRTGVEAAVGTWKRR